MYKYLVFLMSISTLWSNNYFYEASLSQDLVRTKNVYENLFYEQETDLLFSLNFSVGREINLYDKFTLEPFLGAKLVSSFVGATDYSSFNIALPVMFNTKKFKVGPFVKYEYIPKIISQQVSFKDINHVLLGGRIMTKGSTQLFFDYEYLLNNKYSVNDKSFGNVDLYLGSSKISIGIRKKF